jgi:hypothetical protein
MSYIIIQYIICPAGLVWIFALREKIKWIYLICRSIFIVGGVSSSYTTNDSPFKVVVVTMFLNPAAHNACYGVGTFIYIGASSMGNLFSAGTCMEVPFLSQVHIWKCLHFRRYSTPWGVAFFLRGNYRGVAYQKDSWYCNKKEAHNLSYWWLQRGQHCVI